MEFGADLIVEPARDACTFWRVRPPQALENEPVRSDIPTLILASEYDPITPPELGRRVAQTFSRSVVVEFPGFGHGALGARSAETANPTCAMRIVAAFLDDPTAQPDTSCIGTLPPLEFIGRQGYWARWDFPVPWPR